MLNCNDKKIFLFYICIEYHGTSNLLHWAQYFSKVIGKAHGSITLEHLRNISGLAVPMLAFCPIRGAQKVSFMAIFSHQKLMTNKGIFMLQSRVIISPPHTHSYLSDSSFSPLETFQRHSNRNFFKSSIKWREKEKKTSSENCCKGNSLHYSLSSWHFINISIKSVSNWRPVLCMNNSA